MHSFARSRVDQHLCLVKLRFKEGAPCGVLVSQLSMISSSSNQIPTFLFGFGSWSSASEHFGVDGRLQVQDSGAEFKQQDGIHEKKLI